MRYNDSHKAGKKESPALRKEAIPHGGWCEMKIRIKKMRPVMLCLLLVAIFISVCFGQQLLKIVGLNQEIAALEADKSRLQEESVALEEEIADLHNNDYLMVLARENFSMILPGEKLYLPSTENETVMEHKEVDGVILH